MTSLAVVEANVLCWADSIVMHAYFEHYLQEAIERGQPDDDPPLWRMMAPTILLDDGV